MKTQQAPNKWPFPPVKLPAKSRSTKTQARSKAGKGISRGAMLADVCLVAIWGATIPGLMWLGSAGGF